MAQKLTLNSNGLVSRMRPVQTKHGARSTPAIQLSRLQQLLKEQHPRICVVRGEGLGDVLTATPVVRALKSMFSQVDITFATNTTYLDGALYKALLYNPDISHIIDRNLLDEGAYDLIVNLHCPAIQFEKRGKFPPSRIEIFANHAGVQLKDGIPKFYVQKEEVEKGGSYLQAIGKEKIILVQPFSSTKQRNGMQGKMKEALIKLYNSYGIHSVIITHSTDDASDILWNNLPGSINLKDLDVREIAGVMVHCDLVLCPDSSILHLAGALGVPTVGIFGPTPPQNRLKYYLNTVAIWEAQGLAPCPCWFEQCPIGQVCWARITTDMIIEKCVTHLQNSRKVNIVQLLETVKPIEIETEIL